MSIGYVRASGGIGCVQAGRELCRLSAETLTQLKMQKILYYAHMIHLGKRTAPLIRNTFLAWKHGPVALGLYEHVKEYGAEEIPLDAFKEIIDLGKMENYEAEAESLQETYGKLKDFSASRLVNASHNRNGAWHKTLRMGKVEIPDDFIEEEYSVCSIIR